jgi:GntR family transcriptional regulator
MLIAVDPTSTVPIYLQVVEAVQTLVATGALKPGDQLPTVRQLAVDVRVNPNTIARAYLELDRKGVITTQQGRGTYVRDIPDAAALAQRRQERLHALAEHFLLDALSQGYTLDDVLRAVEEQSTRWRSA